jgi:hypothetical protein
MSTVKLFRFLFLTLHFHFVHTFLLSRIVLIISLFLSLYLFYSSFVSFSENEPNNNNSSINITRFRFWFLRRLFWRVSLNCDEVSSIGVQSCCEWNIWLAYKALGRSGYWTAECLLASALIASSYSIQSERNRSAWDTTVEGKNQSFTFKVFNSLSIHISQRLLRQKKKTL